VIANQIAGALGAQPPAWTPASLTGLKAWYDASDTATISVSGTAVTQWNDKSGNGYNVTQGTSANRPTSGVSTLNSKNVIDFDGTNDFLKAATASDWAFMVNNTNYMLGVVVKVGNTSDPETFCGIVTVPDLGTAYPTFNIYADYRGAKNDLQHYSANSSFNTVIQNTITSTFAANTWSNVGLLGYPASGTAANRSYLYKNNGSAVQTNTATSTPNTATNPATSMEIGRYQNGSAWLVGSIAEIVIAGSSGTNDTNRILLRDYFTAKWGV
jgi:hypothetical protein